ncbi:MAG: EthD family reductase [Betaproteobacteria bacterium]
MAVAKLIVLYPMPKDLNAFERSYADKHIPMAAPIFQAAGATKAVLSKVSAAPGTAPSYYRIAEIHFPSMEVLQACAASQPGKDALAHAFEISNGGPPTVLIGAEDVVTF